MLSGSWNTSIKYKLVALLLLLSIIPIFVLGYINYIITSKSMIERVMKDSNNITMNKIQNIDNTFLEIEDIIINFVTSEYTQNFLKYIDMDNFETYTTLQTVAQIESRADYIMTMQSGLIRSFMVLPREGGYPFFRGYFNPEYSKDFSSLDIYQTTKENKDKLLWTLSEKPEQYFTVSRTISDVSTNEVIGVIALEIYMSFLEDIVKNIMDEHNEFIYIIDSNNTVVYHSGSAKIGNILNDTSIIENMRNKTTDSFIEDVYGEESIISFSESNINNWKIVYIIPSSSVTADINRMAVITVLIALGCAVYAIFIALLVFNYIYRPLNTLSVSMDEVSRGNMDIQIKNQYKDEFGRIFGNFNNMVVKLKDLIRKIKDEQRMKKEHEIHALQAQIMPHFLYNTLNSIKALAAMDRTKDIQKMVVSFIKLLRVSMSYDNEFITIREELEYVKSYVTIMQFRYDSEFILNIDAKENLLNFAIPKFIIQPIVENCIIHAFEENENDKNIINICVKESDKNGMSVIVSDNGKGFDAGQFQQILNGNVSKSKNKFSKIGIKNVNERIKLAFGDEYCLNYKSEPGKGTIITINIPCLEVD